MAHGPSEPSRDTADGSHPAAEKAELAPGSIAWDAVRAEIGAVLRESARTGQLITYLELTARLNAVRIQPDDPALAGLLRAVSEEEEAAGRGLLTAIVVRRDRALPGNGFFALTALHGRDVSDRARAWDEERARVFSAHRQPPGS